MARIRRAIHARLRGSKLRQRIAWLSPMPPAPTGIATYSAAVLEGLARIGFTDRHAIEPLWPIRRTHEATVPLYAMGVYHLGNNMEFHRAIYRHALSTPGLVVLHDLALDDFVNGLLAARDPMGPPSVREALRSNDRLRLAEARANEPLRIPWGALVARRARGIVVHSDFGRRYLRAFGCRTPVFVVPHPVVERDADIRRARERRAGLRAPLEARGMRTLVGMFGDLNGPKLIDACLESVRTLPASVHLVVVGRRIEGYDVDAVLSGGGLGERATLLTGVSDDDFLAWMCATDVIVNLRHPHRGEVSGSLARAMQCGRPTIVSGTGTYRDLSDDVVVHVNPGRVDPGELGRAIMRLADDLDLRAKIGGRAAAHVEDIARSDRTAHGYAEAIEGTLTLLTDPSRRAMSRWARALADFGVTEEDMRLGYGVSYTRALEELRPPGTEG